MNDFGLKTAARTGDLICGRLSGKLVDVFDGLFVLCELRVRPTGRRTPPSSSPRQTSSPPTEVSSNTYRARLEDVGQVW